MSSVPSPTRWAIDLSLLLNAAKGKDQFPVNIRELALEYSRTRFPDDPVSLVASDNLPGFDGALIKAPQHRRGWGIFYNKSFSSKGRINFTLAHEFGHYLLHRKAYPQGFRCNSQDVVRWDSAYGQVEYQANVFAAGILMPLDDYRKQIPDSERADLDMLASCSERYRVSLIAAILRWLEYTNRRAVLVLSRDGYILWARSSERALRTKAYFRTSQGPVEIPAASHAATQDQLIDGRIGVRHGGGVWFAEPVHEMTIFAEQYDFVISLLLLESDFSTWQTEASEPDTFDRMSRG